MIEFENTLMINHLIIVEGSKKMKRNKRCFCHVNREEATAVATSNSNCIQQAAAWDTHLDFIHNMERNKEHRKKKKKIRPERESIDWATNKEQNCTVIYQQNGGAVTALNIANLLGKINEMVEGRHFVDNEMGGTLGFWVYV